MAIPSRSPKHPLADPKRVGTNVDGFPVFQCVDCLKRFTGAYRVVHRIASRCPECKRRHHNAIELRRYHETSRTRILAHYRAHQAERTAYRRAWLAKNIDHARAYARRYTARRGAKRRQLPRFCPDCKADIRSLDCRRANQLDD